MTHARPGRPALPPEERRGAVLRVRLTKAEAEAVQARADSEGVAVASLVRRSLGLPG